MPAGTSEDFLFCAVEIDSLLLLLLLNAAACRHGPRARPEVSVG